MRWLAPSLLCLAVAAGEPLTATPWDVRKDASELLDEIARSSGDAGDLLSRARTLILDHGHQLIATAGNEASPIADALTARLGSAGLGERFANELAPAAERKLSELLARSADAGAWANLARTLPGTPAAAKAWRRAADLAWDRGLIRLYQDAAIGAGDAADSVRSARLSAAAGMLISTPLTVPDSLDQLETMWQIGASQAPGPAAAPATAPARRRARVQPSLGRPGAAACGDGAIAVANGQSLLVIDHLVGAPLGARIVLGNRALPAHVARPEPIAGGAVAVGLSEGRMVLVCADAAGSERWRFGGSIDSVEMVGAPVALDTLVVVPYRVLAEDRIEMRVLAVSARDGQLVWDTLIGQLLTTAWGGNGLAAPAVARHARGLVAFSNAGSYALLGGDGALRRMWSYPTRPELEIDGGRRGRRGLAASDGATVVATPADHAGLVLVLGPNDAAPRAYRGDGADGDVLAVQAGDALIAGRQVALVDTVRLRLRWAAPLRLSEAQGLLANATVLVAGNDQLALLARGNGTLRSSRATGQPATLAVGDGVLVLAEHETVRGFGDAKAFIDKLQQAAAAAGSDPRPHAALGAVLAGRGDAAGALAAWRTALGLGAGPAIAERMARLLRNRLALATTPGEMNAALDQLDQLSANLPGVADEIRLWRARIAESAGDKAAAASHFAAVLAGADRLLTLPDGLSISIRMLAEAGAARQGGSAWKPLTASDAPLPEAGTWSVPARISGRAVIGGSTVCAFADGLLRAWRLNDGSEAWRRKPQRALLGVQPWRDAAADGVAVQVMPGTAGAAAGLVDGDVLLSLNGEPCATSTPICAPACSLSAVAPPSSSGCATPPAPNARCAASSAASRSNRSPAMATSCSPAPPWRWHLAAATCASSPSMRRPAPICGRTRCRRTRSASPAPRRCWPAASWSPPTAPIWSASSAAARCAGA